MNFPSASFEIWHRSGPLGDVKGLNSGCVELDSWIIHGRFLKSLIYNWPTGRNW